MASGDRAGAEEAWRKMLSGAPARLALGGHLAAPRLRPARGQRRSPKRPTTRPGCRWRRKRSPFRPGWITDAPRVADSGPLVAARDPRCTLSSVVRAFGGTAKDELSPAEKMQARARDGSTGETRKQAWKDLGKLGPRSGGSRRRVQRRDLARTDRRQAARQGEGAGRPDRRSRGQRRRPAATARGTPRTGALRRGQGAGSLAKRVPEALDRWGALEAQFPDDHLADDARFQAALQVQSGRRRGAGVRHVHSRFAERVPRRAT